MKEPDKKRIEKVPKGRMLMDIDISYDVLSGKTDVEEDETCH